MYIYAHIGFTQKDLVGFGGIFWGNFGQFYFLHAGRIIFYAQKELDNF